MTIRITISSAAMPTAGEAAQERMASALRAALEGAYVGADVRVSRYGASLLWWAPGGWEDLPRGERRAEIEAYVRDWLETTGRA